MKIRMLTGLFVLLMFSASQQAACAAALSVKAKSAILIEAKTGRVIMEKDAEARAFPASTTKMVTGILAMESGRLADVVTVSKRAAETEGSSIWLEPGERLTLEQLCYGLMLHSGNDAANAIAEYLGGSEANFVAQMNLLANKAGATNTRFANANGLPDGNHYTTAHDLSRIAAYGLRNPGFRKVVATDHALIPWGDKPYQRELFNTNHLLNSFDGANGVKTGYTDAAGHCLVASAQRNGLQLIAVILDSDDMWTDAAAMLETGFSQLRPANYLVAGQPLTTIPVLFGAAANVTAGSSQTLVLPAAEEKGDYRYVVNSSRMLVYPPAQGAVAGSVSVYYQGVLIEEVPLYYIDKQETASAFKRIVQFWQAAKQSLTLAASGFSPDKRGAV